MHYDYSNQICGLAPSWSPSICRPPANLMHAACGAESVRGFVRSPDSSQTSPRCDVITASHWQVPAGWRLPPEPVYLRYANHANLMRQQSLGTQHLYDVDNHAERVLLRRRLKASNQRVCAAILWSLMLRGHDVQGHGQDRGRGLTVNINGWSGNF